MEFGRWKLVHALNNSQIHISMEKITHFFSKSRSSNRTTGQTRQTTATCYYLQLFCTFFLNVYISEISLRYQYAPKLTIFQKIWFSLLQIDLITIFH